MKIFELRQIGFYRKIITSQSRNMTLYKTSIEHIQPSNNVDHVVDLRSDTVTKPCPKMKQAMIAAPLGDDVFQEDPTICAIETRIAELTNKEAGLFVASGTMGNFLSVLAHTDCRGAEVLIGDESHIHRSEQGNISQFGGVTPHMVPTKSDGTYCLKDLAKRIRSDDFHEPKTKLICIENTHGNLGGKVLPLTWIDQLCEFAHERNISVHMDGARIFSASVASNTSVSRILQNVDSASMCLSKNLGAPIGSLIVGKKEFVDRARFLRKGLGGGWRQAGIIGAAGLYALENNIDRLIEDHTRAKILASAIHEMGSKNVYVKPDDVHTGMVFVYVNPDVLSPEDLCARMLKISNEEEASVGSRTIVKAFPQSENSVRLVLHLDVTQDLLDATVAKFSFIIKEIDQTVSSN